MLVFFYLILSYILYTFVEISVIDDGGFTSRWITLAGFFLVSFFVFFVGRLISILCIRSIRNKNFRKANLLRNSLIFLALAMFVVLVIEFHWRHFILDINILGVSPGKLPVLKELLFIFPVILNYYLIMLSQYEIDKITRSESFSFRAYFDFNFRLLLMPLPLLILISLADFTYNFVDSTTCFFSKLEYVAPILAIILALAPVFVIAMFFPMIIRYVLRAKVLPESEIRTELSEIAKKAGVKYRNILIWETGALRVPNAMVVGFFSWVRYVFITDTILNNFSREEIKGVFAHELGHAKNHHLLAYFLTILSFSFITFLVLEPLSLRLGFFLDLRSADIFTISEIMSTMGFILVLFTLIGVISRKFERQSDLFAAKLIGFANFIDALYGIARIYGGKILTKPSITHGSLQTRINFLYTAEYDQKIADDFTTKMNILKYVFIAVILAITALSAKEILKEVNDFDQKARIYNAIQVIESFDNKGFLTKADNAEIEANLEFASSKKHLLPEVQYIKAMKILETEQNLWLDDAKSLLEQVMGNPHSSQYLRLIAQSAHEQLK